MIQQLLPFTDRSREIYACDVVWGYFLWLEYYTLLLLDKMHCPCMCVYLIYSFIFFVDIFFYYTTKSLSLVGGAFSVVDYILVVVVCWCCGCFRRSCCGCGLYLESVSDTESPSSKPTRLNKEEFLVTWWSPLCTVTILPFFFVTVYCLGLYGGDSLFCLFCLIRIWSPRQRGEGFVFCFCLHTISLSPFFLYSHLSVLVLGS